MPSLSQNQQAMYDYLCSRLPKRFNPKTNPGVSAILLALAQGDGFIDTLIQAAGDNMYVIKAWAKWLDARGALYGADRTAGQGIGDDDYRNLIPIMGMSPKQIATTIDKLLDAAYGPYAAHANVTSTAAGPFRISENGNLSIKVDGQTTFDLVFTSSDAVSLSAMTAAEFATAVTAKTSGQVIGSVLTNSQTGAEYVNLRTATIGTQGFLQILGGDVLSSLRFPPVRATIQGIGTWAVSQYGTADEMLFTLNSGTGPLAATNGVQAGDIVTIRQDSGFNTKNVGSFTVTWVAADNSSFRVRNNSGVAETVTQKDVDDFTFFSPQPANITLNAKPSYSISTTPGLITIRLPANTPIVKRAKLGAAYFQGAVSTATAVTSNTITLQAGSAFPSSGAVRKLSSRSFAKSAILSVGATTITLASAAGFPSYGAVYSSVTRQYYYYSGISGNILQNVTGTPPNSIVGSTASYDERYQYSGISGNQLTGVFPDPSNILGWELSLCSASLVSNQAGGFLYDSKAGYTLSSIATTISQTIQQGSSAAVLSVADCSGFPDTGWLLFEGMTGNQDGPIPYLGKTGTTGFIMNPKDSFQYAHLSGTEVRLVTSLSGYQPRSNGGDYPVFLTSAAPARGLIETFIQDLIAGGMVVEFLVSVPDQKWPTLINLQTATPTGTTL